MLAHPQSFLFFHPIPKVIKKVVCNNLGANTPRTVDSNSPKGIPKVYSIPYSISPISKCLLSENAEELI